jgi:F-type H+-transporting ATPase subunit gamma
MASLKEIRGRIQSVNSTQQMTKAMKMVAAAKLRRAQDGIIKIRPYSEKLKGILDNVTATLESSFHNPYAEERSEDNILIVVITSDRGLAGAFNANIGKAVVALLTSTYKSQVDAGNVDLLTIGKKGNDFLLRREYKTNTDYLSTFSNLSFDNARKAAEFAMDQFVSGTYDKVVLVYNEFKNVATQFVQVQQFLPIVADFSQEKETASSSSTDYIFEPSKVEIVQDLIPKTLKIQFYKALLESNASEQGARMTAMEKATENASDMLKELKLTYNRSRQAAITKEILEIVGGAEALNG